MAKIKYIADKNQNKIYTVSHTKAVYDSNGKVLEDRLTEESAQRVQVGEDAKKYTDEKINALVNGAPETLDTLKEVADAIKDNETVVSALNSAIGSKADKSDLDNKLGSDSAISDTIVAFTEASKRENIDSNEKTSTLFGKIKKWFSDLKSVAFTGSYNDLNDKPANATSNVDGLMSKTDKQNLDNLINSDGYNLLNEVAYYDVSEQAYLYNGLDVYIEGGTTLYYNGAEIANQNDIVVKTATTTEKGLMSASDKVKLNGIATNANNYTHPTTHDASMITQDSTHRFVTDTEKTTWNNKLDKNFVSNDYSGIDEVTNDLKYIMEKNIDSGLDFVYNISHYNNTQFDYSSSQPVYIATTGNGKWYYDGNEIATKADIPSTSDFLKTSGGTMSGTYTLTSGYGINSSYSSNLKLLRVNSSSNYFGEQAGSIAMYNYFGYRNSATTTTITNHFGSSYSPSYATNIMNYYGRYANTNHFGANATNNYFGSSATTSYYRGNTIYLGDLLTHPVYMQGSTSYKVVGTTTGYNTKVHVASSQPSNMSIGDIWFKIPS